MGVTYYRNADLALDANLAFV